MIVSSTASEIIKSVRAIAVDEPLDIQVRQNLETNEETIVISIKTDIK